LTDDYDRSDRIEIVVLIGSQHSDPVLSRA
jgi:hypothetical protein